jgi:manganese/zinc/iron transport system permease protein
MSSYWGVNFFEFFLNLFHRLFTGNIFPLATDEVQMLVLSLSAISCGLISPFIVLKRMSMFANSLSHTILVGIIGAYLIASYFWNGGIYDLSTLLLGALVAALLTTLFTEGLVRLFRLQEDASIGLVFTALFALGVLMASLFTKDVHLGIEAVMGNADALRSSDIGFAVRILALNALCIGLFYSPLKVACFDQGFARSIGIRCGALHFLVLTLTAITCVGAFRAVGVLLLLGFLVGPYLTARLFCKTIPQLLFWCPMIGILASITGVALSRHILSVFGLPLSTGGIVVCLVGLFYCGALLINRFTMQRRFVRLDTR